MHRLIARAPLVACAAALLLALARGADSAPGDWTFVPPPPALRSLHVIDLDGDGQDELVTIGLAASPNWPSPPATISAWAFSSAAPAPGLVQTGARVERAAGNAFVVHDIPGFPGASLFVTGDAENLLLRGRDLALAASFPSCSGTTVSIGDLEGNGRLEAVEVFDQTIAICDATTGETLRSIATSSTGDVAVGQLDDDAALEIVVGGNPLRVIDGATLETQWSCDCIGARPSIDAAATGTDARFVFGDGNRDAVIVASHPLRVDHGVSAPEGTVFPAAWTFIDTDGDGASELLCVGRDDAPIRVLDPESGAPRYAIGVDVSLGDPIGPVTLARAAAGEPRRLVWIDNAGAPWNGSHLFVADATRSGTAFTRPGEGVSSLAIGDVYGDGVDEVIAATKYGATGTTTRLRALDRETGVEKWAIDYVDARDGWPSPVALARVEADAPARIFAAQGTTIAVFDGVTRTELYTMNRQNPSLWLPNLFLLRTGDINADGRDDLVAADAGSGVYVLDTTTAAIEWLAMPFDEEVRDVEVIDRGDGAPRDLLVVQSPHLSLLSGASHAMLWSQTLPPSIPPQERVVATHVVEGVDGPEIIVGADDELVAYDAATGLLLRTVPLYDLALASTVRFVAAPSGRSDRLLVSTYAGLEIIDATIGGRGVFPLVIGADAGAGNVAFIAADPASGRHELIVASDGGFARRSIVDRERLFGDGFDPR